MTGGPLLVADIGGTNARFAIVQTSGDTVAIHHRRTFLAEDFDSIHAAARAYLGSWNGPPPFLGAFAVAGPLSGDHVKFTNSSWEFAIGELRDALGLHELRILNDYEAQARGVGCIATTGFELLKPGTPVAGAPQIVFGPGTGLGLSQIVPTGDTHTVIATEAGHVAFAPADAIEVKVLEFIRTEHDYVSYEHLLSGPGLVNIHRALCAIKGVTRTILSPRELTDAALSRSMPVAVEVVNLFCAVLGGFAGGAVLMTGARGGAFIAGGIAPKLLPLLRASAFTDRFTRRGAMSDYLAACPVQVIVSEDAALFGAASLYEKCW